MKKIFTLLALMVAIGASAEITEVDLNEGSNIKVILGANFNNVDSLKVTGYLSHSNLEKIAWQTRSKIRYLDLGDCEVENNEIPECGINPMPHSVISEDPLIYYNVLSELILPKNLEKIGAFAVSTTWIKYLDIPKSVKSIGEYAFDCCHNLQGKVVIPENVDSLFMHCFYYDDKITEIELSRNLKYIEEGALAGLINLKAISFHEGLEVIGYDACAAWYNFEQEQVTFPSTLKTLEGKAFRYSRIKDIVFNIDCPLQEIGQKAFESNKVVQRIVLPKHLKVIDSDAFNKCTELISVYVAATEPPTINLSTFSELEQKTLYVPVGAREAYAATEYWKDFGEIVEVEEFPSAGREAVIAASEAVRAFGACGAAVIEGDGCGYSIYAADGRMVAAGTANGRTEVALPRGIYIVDTAGVAHRIAVR